MASREYQMVGARTQKSLLNPLTNTTSEFAIFFMISERSCVSVILSKNSNTVQEAIQESIQKFNFQHKLNLKQGFQNYVLYGARKNGKRKSDLPSIAYEQNLAGTKLKRFTLFPLYNYRSPFVKTSESLREIQSNISIKNQKLIRKQTPQEPIFGCFCLKK